MNRRKFITRVAGATGGLAISSTMRAAEVKRVLVMFKCHLDIGFVDTQAAIIRKYFEQYYPLAINIAAEMRQAGQDRYVWTTGSWLLYEYLGQAAPEPRKRMEQAVAGGDIAWHALPFNWQTELLDRSMIVGALGFSKSLDRRFGRTTTGCKMTDVPGHSRGLIGPLMENGVKFLDVGVNSASTPPDVPPVFLWKDPRGASLVVMYHHQYGGVVPIPGSDLAIAIEVRNDNSGPHTLPEIRKIYADLRKRFPDASVRASNLTEIANAVDPFRKNLPVLTQEIGDTWIYGVASDPVKMAHYRQLLRLRKGWIDNRRFKAGDAADLAFLEKFSLAAEHTWGTDTKTWLDFDHYTPKDLAQMLDRPNYKTVTNSWAEKRQDIAQGVAALPANLRTEAEQQLAVLKAVSPNFSGMKPAHAADLVKARHFTLALDPATGAIRRLRSNANGREWAGPEHPLALFTYQTLSKGDYDRFLASYITVKTDWAPKDFGKPGIERFGAQSRTWMPRVTGCWSGESDQGHTILAKLEISDAAAQRSGVVAWPDQMYLRIGLPAAEPAVLIEFTWLGKKANRLPEALWLTFQPNAPQSRNWTLDKVDQAVSPFDVVRGGNRHMHGVMSGIRYQDSTGRLEMETLDAPLLVLGERSPIYFSNDQPDLAKGIHVSLFNNGWGTNYIQWFGENMKFRFVVRAA